MKKYFLLGLIVAIAPNICFGAGARYTQLVREKQRKMEELEKCMGSSKGLKIAGLSTIGLTAVGVAGNIAEAQKLQEYDDAIAKKNKDIETKEKAIVAEQEKIAKKQQEKSNPTPAPINENQQQCINRVNGEFMGGIPSKYQDSYAQAKKALDDLLEETVDEDGGMIWHGHKVTCKKGTKFKDCKGVNDFLQGVLKAAVTDKECGTHLFNEIEEAKFLDSTDVAVDTFTENCKNSGGMSLAPGTCYCLYGTANFMGQCPSLSTGPVNNKNLSIDKSGTPASGQGNGSATELTTNVSQQTKRNLDGNNPNMLKNLVERDIAAINATTAKLGAKIYVSGYSSLDLPDGDLFNRLRDAYTDFNDRCSALGVEYSSKAIDARATSFGDELDLNTILTDTTQYVLSECWCFTEEGYEKQGDKCVKK